MTAFNILQPFSNFIEEKYIIKKVLISHQTCFPLVNPYRLVNGPIRLKSQMHKLLLITIFRHKAASCLKTCQYQQQRRGTPRHTPNAINAMMPDKIL